MNLLLQMLEGTVTSLRVFFLTLVFSIPLGVVVSMGRMSRNKLISTIVNIYIMIMRGTPLILQLIFVYFAPYYIFGASLSRFWACIVAFVINYAAYFAEIFRSGFQSIDPGQSQAAKALGLSSFQELWNIKMPQMIRIVIPSVGNEVITLVKDTALAQTIGVAELFRVAQNASSRQFSTMPIFIAGVFYFVMNAIVSKGFTLLEKKYSWDR